MVNANGTAFSEGDEVFVIIPANLNMKTGHGALCQYAVVKVRHDPDLSWSALLQIIIHSNLYWSADFRFVQEENLTKKPAGLSFEDIAGLPLVGLTAYGGLLEQGGLKSGQKVFINGALSSSFPGQEGTSSPLS